MACACTGEASKSRVSGVGLYSISQYPYFVAFVTIWEKMKSPDSRAPGVFVPEIVVTRLAVEPST